MSDLATVDPITPQTLAELATLPGPWATITMPTARTGPEVRQDPIRFKVLAARAVELLKDRTSEAELEQVAAQLDAVHGDRSFWEHQADGLIVLAAPHALRTFRVGSPLPEGVRAAAAPGLAELAAHQDAGGVWFIVALSQNRVRLLQATEHTVEELPLEGVPASFDDAVGDIERQEHLSWTARPGGGANFHGLGGGVEYDKVWLEKYLRRVVHGLDFHSSHPGAGTVVLAGVEGLVSTVRSMWRVPGLLDASVPGNPDHLSARDLHAAALPLLDAERERLTDRLLERLGAAGQHGLGDILRAAAEGRVAELALGPSIDSVDRDSVDTAVRNTVAFGGTIRAVRRLSEPMAALTRY